MLTTMRTAPVEARKARTGGTVRASTRLLTSNDANPSSMTLRLQRLRLLGIIGRRADLLASLAWGEA